MYARSVIAFVLGVVFTILVTTSSFFTFTYERYLRGGDVELIVERKEELAMGGGFVNHAVDPLAAFIGPFPSIVIKISKEVGRELSRTSLNAPGLLYRMLLVAPFILGAYYVFRFKQKKLYPLVIFFLINALGVAISVKGLEYRITHPHLAMAYIVAFWWLAKYDYKQLSLRLSSKTVYWWFLIVFVLALIWNLR